MPSIEQRRPLRPGGVDLLSTQPPGATPGILAMYPGCTPRPRDRRTYEAACGAANGELVQEFHASAVGPGARAWCGGSFLIVIEARVMTVGQIPDLVFSNEAARAHRFVLLRLEGDGATTGWIIGELDTPVYCLA